MSKVSKLVGLATESSKNSNRFQNIANKTRNKVNYVSVHAKPSEELHRRLKIFCFERKLKINDVLITALKQYLEENE